MSQEREDIFVERKLRRLTHQGENREESSKDIRAYRELAAWVLLAEPGAGKTSLFRREADDLRASGENVEFLRIGQFVSRLSLSDLKGKILFLDGMDEYRAGASGEFVLDVICARLDELGQPRFRLSCRAADWFGFSDKQRLQNVSSDGSLELLELEDLSNEDIRQILSTNHAIADPQSFMGIAENHGLQELLHNPETLGLLAGAIRSGNWPETRTKTFHLACEQLALEANPDRRHLRRSLPSQAMDVLAAAGHLFAIVLLAGKVGIALDVESESDDFPCHTQFDIPDAQHVAEALETRIFRQEGEQRLVPVHRVVAEFLAARWIANEIDERRVGFTRVLRTLRGADGGIVSSLRGIYGWLVSQLSTASARTALVEIDPRAIIHYGDPKSMSTEDRKTIFVSLMTEISQSPAIRYEGIATPWWGKWRRAYGALSAPGLESEFRKVLADSGGGTVARYKIDCVLDILKNGEDLPGLNDVTLGVVRSNAQHSGIRAGALDVWMRSRNHADEALALLEEIRKGEVVDPDGELAGILLAALYPRVLSAEHVVQYLGLPDSNMIGSHSNFWNHILPAQTLPSQWLTLLDCLMTRADFTGHYFENFHVKRIVDTFTEQILKLPDDLFTDAQLWSWLGLGLDEYGTILNDWELRRAIAEWLESRPERYKALLEISYSQCERESEFTQCLWKNRGRVREARPPDDILFWHLDHAADCLNPARRKEHLQEASAIWFQLGHETDMFNEHVVAWKRRNPELALEFDELVERWRSNSQEAKRQRLEYENDSATRRVSEQAERVAGWVPFLGDIRDGRAAPSAMNQLALIESAQRFDEFFGTFGDTLQMAAREGFRACVVRKDLPALKEIFSLHAQQNLHYLQRPCLEGMELLWRDDASCLDTLSVDILERMVAFRCVALLNEEPAWFTQMAQSKVDLVGNIFTQFIATGIKYGTEDIVVLSKFSRDDDYAKIAAFAAPRLLVSFPRAAASGQMRNLIALLKVGWQHARQSMPDLVEKKLAVKNLSVWQKTLWLLAGALLEPQRYDETLWQFVGQGDKQQRGGYIVEFLTQTGGRDRLHIPLSECSLARLIELRAPAASPREENAIGRVTDFNGAGEYVESWVNELGARGTDTAVAELHRLLTLPTIRKWTNRLMEARREAMLNLRERNFRFLAPKAVAAVLANRAPSNAGDLAALVHDSLNDIEQFIRNDNADLFRMFWNVDGRGKPIAPRRAENVQRDVLLLQLRDRLVGTGVVCEPEGDYSNDKRADVKISYGADIAIPIEVKCSDYGDVKATLASKLKTQLIGLYSSDVKAVGYGIYVVFWLGERYPWDFPYVCHVGDNGKHPDSAAELQQRLLATLRAEEREHIAVRVLDVSWKF